jgi:hypothetical protein
VNDRFTRGILVVVAIPLDRAGGTTSVAWPLLDDSRVALLPEALAGCIARRK